VTIPVGSNQLTSFNAAAVPLGQGLNNVNTVAINAAGSGYSLGQFVTVSGGTFLYAAQVQITGVDVGGFITGTVGAVTGVSLVIPGVYTANPATTGAATTLNANQGGSGTGLTLNLTFNSNVAPWNAKWAEVTVEGANVRFRDDGTAPTTTVGQLLTTFTGGRRPQVLYKPAQTQVIGVTGSSILNVSYYGFRLKQ
jgi:hypothetical protein